MRNIIRTTVAVASITVMALSTSAYASPDTSAATTRDAAPDTRRTGSHSEELEHLLAAWRATAPFHDVQTAVAAGWQENPECLDFPDGYGGYGPGTMGHHFFNSELINDDAELDPSKPELLLYERRADGSWRLNAVEYIIPEADLPATAPPPRLFGRQLTFHPEFGIWGLHVWLWRYNPYGRYAEVNPNVTCEHAINP